MLRVRSFPDPLRPDRSVFAAKQEQGVEATPWRQARLEGRLPSQAAAKRIRQQWSKPHHVGDRR
jgi:hypothetical protein